MELQFSASTCAPKCPATTLHLSQQSYSLDVCLIPEEEVEESVKGEDEQREEESEDPRFLFLEFTHLQSSQQQPASTFRRRFRIWIVELNGFFPATTGPMSFDWRKDEDLLFYGKKISPSEVKKNGDDATHSQSEEEVEFRQATESRASIDGVTLLPDGAMSLMEDAAKTWAAKTG